MNSRFEMAKQADAYNARVAEKTDALKRWLQQKHPDVSTGEAVIRAFKEDLGDSFLVATDEDFEYSLNTTTTKFSRHRVPTEDEQQDDLIDEICDLLASRNGGRDGKFDAVTLKAERKRMSFCSVEDLTKRRDEIVRKQTLVTKSVSELKEMVRPNQGEPSTHPPLPPEYDAEKLNSLIRFDRNRFVGLCKKYGTQQIDRRRGLR